MSATRWSPVASPLGELAVARDERGLVSVLLPGEWPTVDPTWQRDDAALAEAREQLDAYFAGERRSFELELAFDGTPFQLEVWNALLEIPYGETICYGELASRVGRPNAARAVGAANGANPLSIIVPCHRVIGSDGRLTGYGGGLDAKRRLLDHEAGRIPLLASVA
jgi:methylated-DNA-[protein]-cysteine S-methyltransferase